MTSVLDQKHLVQTSLSGETVKRIREARVRLSDGSFDTLDELKEKLGRKD